MADQEIELSRIVAEITSIGITQLAVEPSPDADLGFRMWGGKDGSGGVTKWLAKDKAARVASMNLQNLVGGGLRAVASDNNGNLVDGSSLIIPAPVQSVFGRTGSVGAQPNDYSAGQVGFTPNGGITATDTQSAVEQSYALALSKLSGISNADTVGFGMTVSPDKVKNLVAGTNIILVDNGTNIELRAAGTTAGLLSRVFLTADTEIVNATSYYGLSDTDKGATPQPVPDMTVTVADDTSDFFTPTFISDTVDSNLLIQGGIYEMLATVKSSTSSAKCKFEVEAYRALSNGTIIASGIAGAPVGSEGVATIGILDSGDISLVAGDETQILLSTIVVGSLILDVTDRIIFKVKGTKVGTDGGNKILTFYCGTNYNTYVDIPATVTTDSIIDTSVWNPGGTLTSTLNTIDIAIDDHVTDTTNPHDTAVSNLNDAVIASLLDKQVLTYDQGSGTWKNLDPGHATFNDQGTWNNATAYEFGDIVGYDGYRWIAKQSNTNQTPTDGSAFWSRIDEQPTLDTFFVIRNKAEFIGAGEYISAKKVALYVGDDNLTFNAGDDIDFYGDIRYSIPGLTIQVNGSVDWSPPNSGTSYTRVMFDGLTNWTTNSGTKVITTKNPNPGAPANGTSFWFTRIRVQSNTLTDVSWQSPSVTDGLRYEEYEQQQGGSGIFSNFVRNMWRSPNYVEITSTDSSVGITENVTNTGGATEETTRVIDLSVVKRGTTSVATATSLSINSSTTEQASVNALASGLTINNPTNGVDGRKIIIRISDNGTARTLNWNAVFAPIGVTLPLQSLGNAVKTIYVGCIYNSQRSSWDVVAVAEEA